MRGPCKHELIHSVIHKHSRSNAALPFAGGLLQGINEDAISIQNAISEKFSNVVHHFCTFIAGFIVGFTYSWDLTLVMVGCLPFLAIMGGIIAKFAATHESFSQKLYTEVGGSGWVQEPRPCSCLVRTWPASMLV